MSTFITGDTHVSADTGKLLGMNFDARGLTKDDYVIVVGDFGLTFGMKNGLWASWAKRRLEWYDSKPWTTLFIDGNHEGFGELDSLPVSKWHGGDVHRLSDSVIHLCRSQIFDIDGRSFFTFGGAYSIDKAYRTEGYDWFPQEVPSVEERERAVAALDSVGRKVDVILTHCAPTNVVFELFARCPDIGLGTGVMHDELEDWLQNEIADKTDFGAWFFGHYHGDVTGLGKDGKFTCLYNNVYDLGTGAFSDRVIGQCVRGNDWRGFPESKERMGYTVEELAAVSNLSVEQVGKVVGEAMRGSTCAMREDGEPLFYAHDIKERVLPYL